MNLTAPGLSFIVGLVALAFAAVTIVVVLRRGYGWVVPVRLALSGLASLTASSWTAKLLALMPDGVLDAHGAALLTALAIFVVCGFLSPTYRQLRVFFFGELDRD